MHTGEHDGPAPGSALAVWPIPIAVSATTCRRRHRSAAIRGLSPWALAARIFLAVLWAPFIAGSSEAVTLYALVDTGEVFASTDSGTTWTLRAEIPVSDAVSLIAGDTPDLLFLASGSGTIHRSEDAGGSWEAIGSVGGASVVDIAGRTDGALLALTRAGGIWVSEDGGLRFELRAVLPQSDCRSLTRGSDGRLHALTVTGTVFESLDGGLTWSGAGGVPVPDAVEIRSEAGALFLLTGTGALFRSDDAGRSWFFTGTTSQIGMTGLAVSGSELVAVHRTGEAARSEGGAEWSWVGSVEQIRTEAIAHDVPQTTAAPAPSTIPTRPRLRIWPNPVVAGTPVALEFSRDLRAIGAADRSVSAGKWTVEVFGTTGRLIARNGFSAPRVGELPILRWLPPPLVAGTYLVRATGPSGDPAMAKLIVLE